MRLALLWACSSLSLTSGVTFANTFRAISEQHPVPSSSLSINSYSRGKILPRGSTRTRKAPARYRSSSPPSPPRTDQRAHAAPHRQKQALESSQQQKKVSRSAKKQSQLRQQLRKRPQGRPQSRKAPGHHVVHKEEKRRSKLPQSFAHLRLSKEQRQERTKRGAKAKEAWIRQGKQEQQQQQPTTLSPISRKDSIEVSLGAPQGQQLRQPTSPRPISSKEPIDLNLWTQQQKRPGTPRTPPLFIGPSWALQKQERLPHSRHSSKQAESNNQEFSSNEIDVATQLKYIDTLFGPDDPD